MPEKSLQYKNFKNDSVKVFKERLTILFACNMSGDEKLKPLVIGRSENPRCFKNFNKANLPVYYRYNNKAWMDNIIFKEWLQILDRKFKSENRQILLLIDNFSGHKINSSYSNIVVKFFSANCTWRLQPLDQGIINAFKIKYRSEIVSDKLEAIEHGKDVPDIDVKVAINKIKKAWNGISNKTIINCFRKAGFHSDFFYGEIEDTVIILQKEFDSLCSRASVDPYYVKIDETL